MEPLNLAEKRNTRDFCRMAGVRYAHFTGVGDWHMRDMKGNTIVEYDKVGDEQYWFVRAEFDELIDLIKDPKCWTKGLGVNLLPNPILRVKLNRDRPPMAIETPDVCLVQGITNTNLITIRPYITPQRFLSWWDAYWKEWATETFIDNGELKGGPVIESVFDIPSKQAFAHMELSKAGESSDERADRIAAFILRAADVEAEFPNADGDNVFAINAIHARQTERTKHTGGMATVTERARICPVEPIDARKPSPAAGIQFTIAYGSLAQLLTPPTACENMAGPIGPNGLVTVQNVVVKSYA